MLTGRESLIRLIGKRRRSLLNQLFISSPDISCTENVGGRLLNACKDVDEQCIASGKSATCPVCEEKVSAEESITNVHLDTCICRGTKRKLNQLTLLQLNFSRRQKVQIQPSILGECETHHDSGDILFHNVEKNDSIICGSSQIDISFESQVKTERTSTNLNICSTNNKELPSAIVESADDVSAMALQTFIVGRRFSDEKELNLGTSISLVRDPTNTNDSNAIKVVSSESGFSKMLGFLPGELAQYLSPLMEKYCMNFEGYVTSDPKNSHAVVPIRIACHQIKSLLDSDGEEFKFLWEKAHQTVDSAKNFPFNTTKYQQNFCLLVEEVLRNNSHLFTDYERSFIESFSLLSNDSQRLFVRLYLRKGPWFRMSNISYTEVFDPQQAIMDLSVAGYVLVLGNPNELHNAHMKEIINLLTVSEIGDIMRRIKKDCSQGRKKQNLIAFLLGLYKDGLCPLLPSLILDITGVCFKISAKVGNFIWRLERLFFLNGEQDLSSFLLVDLGIVKYPTYNCIVSDPVFSSRDDLLAYEEAIEVAQLVDEALDENNKELVFERIKEAESRLCTLMQPHKFIAIEPVSAWLRSFTASWVYSKVILVGVSFLENEHRFTDAIGLLKLLRDCFTHDGRRGYWTLRLSTDLEHVGCPNESLSVAEDGLFDPFIRAGSRMALQRRILRLGKPPRRWKIPSFAESIKRKITKVCIQGRPLNCEIGKKNRYYGEGGEQCGVEQLALEYYAGEGGGWQGVHTESGIWLTIFGVLMWDIIFSDVQNVFRSQFQNAPLDLDTDSFYEGRKSMIESHLEKIGEGMAEEILIMSWESHVGTSCRGVNWKRHSLSELRAAVACIGGHCLAALCRHLAQDYRSWSSGMPDLLLWRFSGEYRGEAKLVEVKGPNDRLSEQQRAWLLLLMDCGFTTEVCSVSSLVGSSET